MPTRPWQSIVKRFNFELRVYSPYRIAVHTFQLSGFLIGMVEPSDLIYVNEGFLQYNSRDFRQL